MQESHESYGQHDREGNEPFEAEIKRRREDTDLTVEPNKTEQLEGDDKHRQGEYTILGFTPKDGCVEADVGVDVLLEFTYRCGRLGHFEKVQQNGQNCGEDLSQLQPVPGGLEVGASLSEKSVAFPGDVYEHDDDEEKLKEQVQLVYFGLFSEQSDGSCPCERFSTAGWQTLVEIG